jgi:pilus assembly protein CpaF
MHGVSFPMRVFPLKTVHLPLTKEGIVDQQSDLGLKNRIEQLILSRLKSSDGLALSTTAQRRVVVEELFRVTVDELDLKLDRAEKQKLFDQVCVDLFGLGPLEALFIDQTIDEIIVIGPKQVYVRRQGKRERSPVTFDGEDHLQEIINRVMLPSLDIASPLGHRYVGWTSITAIAGYTVSNSGSALILRPKRIRRLTAEDLLKSGTLTAAQLQYLRSCVEAKKNILISGDYESGKTRLLSVLAGYVPDEELIVTIEEQHREELRLTQSMIISLHSRPAGVSEYPPITVGELIAHALKMRPEWLLIGDLPVAETSALAKAAYTKWIATAFAPHPQDVTPQLAPTVDLIVHMASLPNQAYRVSDILLVDDASEDAFVLTSWRPEMGQSG